jgi:hypothetical protein
MDTIYEYERGKSLSLLAKAKIELHLLFCPRCSKELEDLEYLYDIMKTDFLPSSPNLEEIIMESLGEETHTLEKADIPGFSYRIWVIIGFFMLFSLLSSFFGMDFIKIADTEGLSFLLPVGLTIGIVLTGYGAFFIGSHLNELSARFKLH